MALSTSSAHNRWPREEFKLSNALELNILTSSRFPLWELNHNEQLQTGCFFFELMAITLERTIVRADLSTHLLASDTQYPYARQQANQVPNTEFFSLGLIRDIAYSRHGP